MLEGLLPAFAFFAAADWTLAAKVPFPVSFPPFAYKMKREVLELHWVIEQNTMVGGLVGREGVSHLGALYTS